MLRGSVKDFHLKIKMERHFQISNNISSLDMRYQTTIYHHYSNHSMYQTDRSTAGLGSRKPPS